MHFFLVVLIAVPLLLLTNVPGGRSAKSVGISQVLISLFVAYWLTRTFLAERYGATVMITLGFLSLVLVESRRQTKDAIAIEQERDDEKSAKCVHAVPLRENSNGSETKSSKKSGVFDDHRKKE